MNKTLALLIGIDNYKSPIPRLYGCVKDVHQIEDYLIKYYGDIAAEREIYLAADEQGGELRIKEYGTLSICTLLNEAATYQHIIKAFRSFLSTAKTGDAVWFHFSGHGSEEWTAKEWLPLEPNGKDQTLVCYTAKPYQESFNLADKEIAVLLSDVATKHAGDDPKKYPQLLVSLDCCHSGSGTRDVQKSSQFRTRNYKPVRGAQGTKASSGSKQVEGRPFDSYIGGYYKDIMEQGKDLAVPLVPHLLMSACNSIQKAGDMPNGGVFTNSLLHALESNPKQLSYADLFLRTRAYSLDLRKEQTPQFEPLGGFNPYKCFLEEKVVGYPDRYEVIFKDRSWYIKSGAIQGLPIKTTHPLKVEIQTLAPENKPLGIVTIAAVGVVESQLALPATLALDQQKRYQAIIQHLPAVPVFVQLHGTDEDAIAELIKAWDDSQNIRRASGAAGEIAPEIAVEASNGHYYMTHVGQRTQVYHKPQMDELGQKEASIIIGNLRKIVKWERFLALQNKRSVLHQQLSLEVWTKDKNKIESILQGEEVNLYLSKENAFPAVDKGIPHIGLPILPRIKVKGATRTLYCYLFHLRSDYKIESYEGEVIFRPAEHDPQQEIVLPLWKELKGLFLKESELNTSSYFKVLVATQKIPYEQLQQAPLGNYRGKLGIFKSLSQKDKEDWCSFQVKVTLLQQFDWEEVTTVNSLFQGNLQLLPPAGLKGAFSLNKLPRLGISQDPAAQFAAFETPNQSLLQLNKGASHQPIYILELLDWTPAAAQQLQEESLKIKLKEVIPKDKMILALAFDGQDFSIAGEGQTEGEDTVISMVKLPALRTQFPTVNAMLPNPFREEDQQHQSLYQACKIAFLLIDKEQTEAMKQRFDLT